MSILALIGVSELDQESVEVITNMGKREPIELEYTCEPEHEKEVLNLMKGPGETGLMVIDTPIGSKLHIAGSFIKSYSTPELDHQYKPNDKRITWVLNTILIKADPEQILHQDVEAVIIDGLPEHLGGSPTKIVIGNITTKILKLK